VELIGPLEVPSCSTGHITLAFSDPGPIVLEILPGIWMLRPVIHVRQVVASGACPNVASASAAER
jgi:hypothetical protein